MGELFATTARGTEEVLAAELGALGLAGLEVRRGGVAFTGGVEAAYRACLWSRVASRVLFVVARFEAHDAQDLYEGVRAVRWQDHLALGRTFAVDAVGRHPAFSNNRFAALKTKDAIVDALRVAVGARPDVDTQAPDVRVHVHLGQAEVKVSIDLAGEGLHRRGIGRAGAAAPLKESLAAALLRIARWPDRAAGGEPLFDPMCGSGTLLLEAAWIALDVAPGLLRARHGFERWLGHEPEVFRALVAEAVARREAARDRAPAVRGQDASAEALRAARANAERAGLGAVIHLREARLADAEPPAPGPGLVVTNPPYGERLGDAGELVPLYEQLGDVLRRRFGGWTAFVLSGNRALDKRIGLRPARRHVLWNGPIECRLLELPISSAPVASEGGPRWRRASEDAAMLENRLAKNLRRLGKWAAAEGLTCYRLYDAEIPEYNLAVDLWDGVVRITEHEPPSSVPAEVAERHLADARLVVPRLLGVDPDAVVLRVRRRRRGGAQVEKRASGAPLREVREGDLRFLVNLVDYLDTGLFLDDRRLRALVRELAAGRDFLNLFAHTCAATVAAAAGGARSTTSVDLSSTYLAWGRENLALNGLQGPAHELLREDALRLLRAGGRRRYGLILLAPPTYSRSRGMRGDFDVQRDHVSVIRDAAALLAPGGDLLFTTNLRTFALDREALGGLEVHEITERTLPPDFRHSRPHRAFRVRPFDGTDLTLDAAGSL